MDGSEKIRMTGFAGVDDVSDLTAWKVTFNGSSHFVFSITATQERFLLQVADTVVWSDVHTNANFLFT